MRWLWRLGLVVLLLVPGTLGLRAETVIERLVSPGALSPGHARLESRCTACHMSFRRSAQATQCLSCHKGIAQDIATRTRWHGWVARTRPQPCTACHVEHRGASGPLAHLDRRGFDHAAMTAYRLTGGHVRTACAGCHGGTKAVPLHWRETAGSCIGCHARRDVHLGRLGRDCAGCHDTGRWRTTLPFDHDRTRYPLTGAHARVSCQGCHAGERWRPIETACVSCHLRQDVHRGADGPKCESCHTTGSWRTIRYDHDQVAAFRLNGAHAAVPCRDCHALTVRPAKAPVTCVGCHLKDDVHRGADGPKCADCHGETTWKVAKFDHAKTAFPLTGLHAKVTCVACHPQSVDKVKVGRACADCHVKDDVHRGALGPMCERCHKVTGWQIPGLPRIPRLPKPRVAGDFPRSGVIAAH